MNGSLRRLCCLILASLCLLLQPYRLLKVEGHSMEPTLHDQGWEIMRRAPTSVRDGDIVAVDDEGEVMVKRVFAMGGERLAGPMGVDQADGRMHNIHDFYTVPKGYLYLVGDNRPISLDSRSFGPVPQKCVLGRLVTG